MAEVQEGDEVRSGMPIVDVVNPASMRVRAKVNQADIGELRVGLRSASDSTRIRTCRSPAASSRFRRSAVQSDSFAEGAQLHRARRRRRLASQPDAGPHRFARRRARARARRARRAARRGRFDGEQAFVRVQRGGGFERPDSDARPA